MTEWFNRFFPGLYTRVLPKTFDEATTLSHARLVKRLLRVRRGASILDVPCGMGRITLPLAEMGLVMTGVDLTGSYLARARRDARKRGLDVRFIESDMRRIDFDREFTAAFNWFGSFGYFSDADNLAFCRAVFRTLNAGGRFLIEGLNKSWMLSHFRERMEHKIGGVRITTRNRWNDRTQRTHSLYTFSRGKTTETILLKMRIFNGADIRMLLRAAGFRTVTLFGWPPLQPFTRHSRRIIAVATKPSGRW
ncbi:MAG: class I SAM-dependent methyltransferase [Planctomycetota bacterium]